MIFITRFLLFFSALPYEYYNRRLFIHFVIHFVTVLNHWHIRTQYIREPKRILYWVSVFFSLLIHFNRQLLQFTKDFILISIHIFQQLVKHFLRNCVNLVSKMKKKKSFKKNRILKMFNSFLFINRNFTDCISFVRE